MPPIISTGLLNAMAAEKSLSAALGPWEIRVFGVVGTVPPANADAAEVGNLLARYTRTGNTTRVARVVTVTPTYGSANAAQWNITLNGVTITVTDAGASNETQVCILLYNALLALLGGAITTPPMVLTVPWLASLVNVVNNGTSLTITAATPGVPFNISSSVSGAGAGDATLVTVETVPDAYGLAWEDFFDMADLTLAIKAGQIPQAIGLLNGNATYGRICSINDDGSQSTSWARIQGTTGTGSPSDIILSPSTQVAAGAPSISSIANIIFNNGLTS